MVFLSYSQWHHMISHTSLYIRFVREIHLVSRTFRWCHITKYITTSFKHKRCLKDHNEVPRHSPSFIRLQQPVRIPTWSLMAFWVLLITMHRTEACAGRLLSPPSSGTAWLKRFWALRRGETILCSLYLSVNGISSWRFMIRLGLIIVYYRWCRPEGTAGQLCRWYTLPKHEHRAATNMENQRWSSKATRF